MTEEIALSVRDDRVSGLVDAPAEPTAALTLAHGAGAGMRHRFMAAVAKGLADRGIAVLRFQFPYVEHGLNRPDAPDVAATTVAAAASWARQRWPDRPLVAAGKSFGGRMSSTAASMGLLPDVSGLVFFGFPLHPPKRPATTRAEHLARVTQPMLFLQGTRDELADLTLIREVTAGLGPRATLHVVEHADHAFAVLKRSGRTDGEVLTELLDTTAGWIGGA